MPAPETSTITLGVGTQKVLNLPKVTHVAVGDPAIADVKATPGGR